MSKKFFRGVERGSRSRRKSVAGECGHKTEFHMLCRSVVASTASWREMFSGSMSTNKRCRYGKDGNLISIMANKTNRAQNNV